MPPLAIGVATRNLPKTNSENVKKCYVSETNAKEFLEQGMLPAKFDSEAQPYSWNGKFLEIINCVLPFAKCTGLCQSKRARQTVYA